MNTRIKVNSFIVVAVAMVLLFVSTNANVTAQDEEPPAPPSFPDREKSAVNMEERETVPGGPGHVMLSAWEFRPYVMDTPWYYFNGVELYNPGAIGSNYVSPVNLPDHAVITQVVFYWWDGVADNAKVELIATTAGTYNFWIIGELYSSGGGLGNTSLPITPPIMVDLSNTAYFLRLNIPGGNGYSLTLLEVRIDYDYPSFVPLVVK